MSLSVFAAAADAPDRPALITDTETTTYAELSHRVRGLVEGLRARSLDGDRPVALVAANDPGTFMTIHALVATRTPALLLHPRLTAAETDALVRTAGAEGPIDPLTPAPPHGPDPAPPPDDERPLAIVHTSGTSGLPKGVVLSRRAFAASAEASAANLGWHDDDRWLLPLPLAHVGGLSILTRTLLARRAVILAPGTGPRQLLDAVRRHRATLLSLVPTVLKRILDLKTAESPPEHLRALLLGGAAASPALLRRAADLGWPVLTTYGLTETCSQATTQRLGTVNRGEHGSGAPLPGVEVRIGDGDTIHVRGPTLFSGYLPVDSDHPPFDADGWFATGDHGRLDPDGNLHVLGRRTDRIVSGGENVDPLEVEQALEALPGIRHACVFGVPDDEWGEVVCAALVLAGSAGTVESAESEEPAGPAVPAEPGHAAATDAATGAPIDAAATALHGLRAELAAFKLPRRFAVLHALPTNATGKLDRLETARLATPRLRSL